MELSDSDIAKIAAQVSANLTGKIEAMILKMPTPPAAEVPRRMTVPQFSVCVNLCREVVRRRIRSRFISPIHVEGKPRGEYWIDRAALAKFNVTQEVALQRLQAHSAKQSAQSHAQSPAQSAA
jgi:hypothetical protein